MNSTNETENTQTAVLDEPVVKTRKSAIIKTERQANKKTKLPVGVTRTWRNYPEESGRSPYLEYQVLYKDSTGKNKIKHFYVGVNPTHEREWEVQALAIAFRKDYEKQIVEASVN